MYQKTIAKPVMLEGVGIHSGKKSSITIKPAEADSGIVFYRTDKNVAIPARIENVCFVRRAVSVGKDGVTVHTIEHLLAALTGLEITNAVVEIDNEETPILDGSAAPIVSAIIQSGIKILPEKLSYISLPNPIWAINDDRYLVWLPDTEFKISLSVDYNHPLLRNKSVFVKITSEEFLHHIAPARTFGFEDEVAELHKKGLALGGTMENAVVLSKDGIVNGELRSDDELLMHKVLDIIGDLSLLGRPLRGHIIARKSGHELDIQFAQKIAAALNNPLELVQAEQLPPAISKKMHS